MRFYLSFSAMQSQSGSASIAFEALMRAFFLAPLDLRKWRGELTMTEWTVIRVFNKT